MLKRVIVDAETGKLLPVVSAFRSALHPLGKFVVSSGMTDGIQVSSYPDLKLIQQLAKPLGNPDFAGAWALAFTPDGKYLLACNMLGSGTLYDAATWQIVKSDFFLANLAPMSMSFSQKGDEVLVSTQDGKSTLYHFPSFKRKCTITWLPMDQYVIVVDSGYYYCTKQAASYLGFASGIKSYPFGNFDLRFNRPDKVLERLDKPSNPMVQAYRQAISKRMHKMGYTVPKSYAGLSLPVVNLELRGLSLTTKERQFVLPVRATDAQHALLKLYVWVNGVPLYGVAGKQIQHEVGQPFSDRVPIPLSAGINKIELSVLNAQGTESLREACEITCTAAALKPTLWVVSIGVSKYQNTLYNLSYAAKDATDIAGCMEKLKATGRYADVKKLILIDAQANKENILRAKIFLQQSALEDEVVFFVAGHGLLDANMDYYFATTDVDFNNPAANGLLYESLEALLDGIPARKKLLLMDTCHSGEVDKEDMTLSSAQPISNGKVVFRSSGRGVKRKSGLSYANTFEMVQELFADIRKGTGTSVISSAGGAEYAFEGSDWNNGVFTYAVLRGLAKAEADENKDGQVSVSELRAFVSQEVSRLTQGRQRPTSRRENLEYDYRVW